MMAFHKFASFIAAGTCGALAVFLSLLLLEPRNVYWYAKLVVCVCLEWISAVLLYRLAFHPLSKYPGPLIAAVTDWYIVYWIAEGGRHLEHHRRHLQYGKYVRYGPNRLSINSPASSRDLHNINPYTLKGDAYSSLKVFFGAEMSMTTSDLKSHAFRRRVNAQALTPAAVANYGDIIIPHVQTFLDIVGQGAGFASDGEGAWSPPKNMADYVAYCVADIMASITFGRSWDAQLETKHRRFVKELPQGVAGVHLVGHMQSLFRFNLHQVLFRELINGVRQLTEISSGFALARMEQKTMPKRDVWAQLLASRDPKTGKAFTKEELASEAGLFIIGGTDAVVTATTSTLFYLLHYPRTLERLVSDIREAFPLPPESTAKRPSDVVCPIQFASESLQKITYLVACIDEALRLSPPIASILPRLVGPGGLVVEGEFFPAGVNLGIPHYSLQRNEEHFPLPHVYRPERWLSEPDASNNLGDGLPPNPQKKETLQPGVGQGPAFTPYGVGRWSCIGKYLAYQELSFILARLLWTFDLRLLPGSTLGGGTGGGSYGRERRDEFQLTDCFVSSQEGPEVQFRYRQGLGQ